MVLEILDSTLRDGEQAEGMNYFSTDKFAIFKSLSQLGFTFIEAGNPASNIADADFFNLLKEKSLISQNIDGKKINAVAFVCTVKDIHAIETDKNILSAVASGAEWISVVGKASKMQVKNILRVASEENLDMVYHTVKHLTALGKKVIFDCEHFFDGYKNCSDYCLQVIDKAILGGAERIVLCDTNGGAFPDYVYTVTKSIVAKYPSVMLGIHCHNDSGMAVANSIMAVKAGARHIQGTLNGYGERCGNANLTTIVANLQLLSDYTILDDECLKKLTSVTNVIAEISNKSLEQTAPFVGRSAFTHKAGLHIDGMIKDCASYEIVSPEKVGNARRILLSQMSGKKAVEEKLKNTFPQLVGNVELLEKFAMHIKKKESEGFIYEAAEASLIIELRKLQKTYEPLFELINYKVQMNYPTVGEYSSKVTLRVRVGDTTRENSEQGNGPVNAMDKALRESLVLFYPYILETSLVDYKVRVINPEATTGALVRVLITSTNGHDTWSTVGVSSDIIEASWQALRDSIEYAGSLV